MKSFNNFIATITFALVGQIVFSQSLSDKTLLTIADTPVTVDEFKSIYLKNTPANASIDQATLEDYLKLFINFKLKVYEAKSLGIDTSAAFKSEYQGYIKQLAQPYLTDATSDEQLLDEAYERMRYEVSASHILINVPESASPADTLKLYQKAIDVRNRILKGEPFGAVALSTSNDPSVSKNNGFLGYFSVFQMVYPFETAAYNTHVDSISMPVRTRFGYHIIKVHDKRPAQGKVKIAHILIRVSPNSNPQEVENARKKIVEVHERIKNGEDFATLARQESQDPSSAKSGGEMPWLSSGQVIPEIGNVAFSLSADGQVSEPFQSAFGWHIVKRLGRKMIGTKEEMLPEIKTMVARDSRNLKSRSSFILKLKNEYGFKEDSSNLIILRASIDSSIYKGEWKVPAFKKNPTLFSFTGGTYKLSDFAGFVADNQRFAGRNSLASFIKMAYEEWVNRTLLEYEESILPEKYADFRQLSKEFYDGMLLFELSNQQVWRKSSDSTGLKNFYESRRDQYKWGDRVHYAVYTIKDAKAKDKFINGLAKRKIKNITPEGYIAKFNKDKNDAVTVTFKSANTDFADIASYKSWHDGINVTSDNDDNSIVTEIIEITNGDLKPLDDCRGQVVAEYQEVLENEWIEMLKAKYLVSVDRNVFNELVESFNKK
ncbi:peptidyl-prolyl cis-trans isomerase [Tenuifilaceae bacterium CYCD]|nr:peptidyl-prolyl cis-trans isomerase [Tenuifilaceae bacterium CYCD]